MAQITVNQHSYTNIAALLNVDATATRTGVDTVSITANWNIYTAGSSYAGATRYLVLLIGSASGKKYYSSVIGSNWEKQKTYKASYTFTGIPLDADVTEITIGFGVSGSNTSLSTDGTLIWNGQANVTSPTYDPDIQFNKITGIAKGCTPCTAPTLFTALPEVFNDEVTLSWSGAKGGTNNAITSYEVQYATSDNGVYWNAWAAIDVVAASPMVDEPGISSGRYQKFRIRTQGSAGSSYYSAWKESNVVRKDNEPYVYIHDDANNPERYLSYIYDEIDPEQPFGKYKPYVFDGTNWKSCM